MGWKDRAMAGAAALIAELDRLDHLYRMRRGFEAMMGEAWRVRLVAQERLARNSQTA